MRAFGFERPGAAQDKGPSTTSGPSTMSPQELLVVGGIHDNWSYVIEDDPMIRVHESFRLYFDGLTSAITTVEGRLARGVVIEPWVWTHLQKFYNELYLYIRAHYYIQEEIQFPYMSTRVAIPTFHITRQVIRDMSDHVRFLFNDLNLRGTATLKEMASLKEDVSSLFMKFKAINAHEAGVILTLWRKHFNEKESTRYMMKACLEKACSTNLGFLTCSIQGDKEKQKWLTRVLKIPAPLVWMFVIPAMRRHNKSISTLLEQVQAGTQATSRTAFFWRRKAGSAKSAPEEKTVAPTEGLLKCALLNETIKSGRTDSSRTEDAESGKIRAHDAQEEGSVATSATFGHLMSPPKGQPRARSIGSSITLAMREAADSDGASAVGSNAESLSRRPSTSKGYMFWAACLQRSTLPPGDAETMRRSPS